MICYIAGAGAVGVSTFPLPNVPQALKPQDHHACTNYVCMMPEGREGAFPCIISVSDAHVPGRVPQRKKQTAL